MVANFMSTKRIGCIDGYLQIYVAVVPKGKFL